MTYDDLIKARQAHMAKRGNSLKDYESGIRKVTSSLHSLLAERVSSSKDDEKNKMADPSYVSSAVKRIDGDTRDMIRSVTSSPIKFLLDHQGDLKLLDIFEPILGDVGKALLKMFHKVRDLQNDLDSANKQLAELKKNASSNKDQASQSTKPVELPD